MIGSVSRIILFVRDVPSAVAFCRDKLGLDVIGEIDAGWTELDSGTINVAPHKADWRPASGGASPAKLVFQVEDVPATKTALEADGVPMSEITTCQGVQFCDGRDTADNPFQISSRLGTGRSCESKDAPG